MFYGQHQFSINEKNRMQIPTALRELFTGKAVITQGFERNILVLPVNVFESLAKLVMALNITDPLARSLQRLLLGNASYCEIDGLGTIEIPVSLKEFSGITAEGILVGQGRYVEAWSPANWLKQELDLQDAEANSQRFVSLNLSGL